MDLWRFSDSEILSFFAVLVRYATLIAVTPLFGDRVVPAPIKVLLALAVSTVLYPTLVATGAIVPADAYVWGSTAWGIVSTVSIEAVTGLAIGFVARIIFAAFEIGGDLIGQHMGYASATQFDPHQESQTQLVSRFFSALAMLLFLALDGHYIMLRACLESFRSVPLGGAQITGAFSQELLRMTSDAISIGLRMSAPIAVSIFAVNVVYGVMARAIPQLNVLVLSLSVSALVGFTVITLSLPEFGDLSREVFDEMGPRMNSMISLLGGR